MKEKELRKKLRKLEERIESLENPTPSEQTASVVVESQPLDTKQLWKEHIADYAAYAEYDEEEDDDHSVKRYKYNGYL